MTDVLTLTGFAVLAALIGYTLVKNSVDIAMLRDELARARKEHRQQQGKVSVFLTEVAKGMGMHWEEEPAKPKKYVLVRDDNCLPHWRKIHVEDVLTEN